MKDSKFELLKIISMLFIVCHHLIAKNVFNVDTEIAGVTYSKLFLQFIGNNAFIANNLFFMVSAWFLCSKPRNFSFGFLKSKFWELEKVMLFYSIGIGLAFYTFGIQGYKIGGVI